MLTYVPLSYYPILFTAITHILLKIPVVERHLTEAQRRPHYRRLGRASRRPGLLHPPRWLPPQAGLLDRRLGFNLHLWLLRRELEGGHGGGGGGRICQGGARRGDKVGRQLRRCYPDGGPDGEGR